MVLSGDGGLLEPLADVTGPEPCARPSVVVGRRGRRTHFSRPRHATRLEREGGGGGERRVSRMRVFDRVTACHEGEGS